MTSTRNNFNDEGFHVQAIQQSVTRQAVASVALALVVFLAACASQSPATARHDQFPMTKATFSVKAIAILPDGGVLADAIGEELVRRGFTVYTAASTMRMVTGVDWNAVSKVYIPGRTNPDEVENLMRQLHAQGIDAFIVLKADGFAPRRWQQYAYWQTVGTHLYSTHPELRGNPISYWGWVNTDNQRARSAAEAAIEIVTRMAWFTSNPL